MPRQSIDAIATPFPVVTGRPAALSPRSDLPEDVAAIFREIVASVDVSALAPCDYPLVESLATAIQHARELGAAIAEKGVVVKGKQNPLCRALRDQQRLIATLATRLRLSPQSRVSRQKAGTNAASGSASISSLYERGTRRDIA